MQALPLCVGTGQNTTSSDQRPRQNWKCLFCEVSMADRCVRKCVGGWPRGKKGPDMGASKRHQFFKKGGGKKEKVGWFKVSPAVFSYFATASLGFWPLTANLASTPNREQPFPKSNEQRQKGQLTTWLKISTSLWHCGRYVVSHPQRTADSGFEWLLMAACLRYSRGPSFWVAQLKL